MDFFLESCCTSVEEVLRAEKAGCRRIELCENLSIGGVTPSPELLKQVLAIATVPVNVLIRPRGGDFFFADAQKRAMLTAIRHCDTSKVNGVVIGALTSEGDVDIRTMRELIDAAGPLSITFHRAFDVCRDPHEAFETIISLGCHHLLTSGHAPDAWTGRHLIAELARKAPRDFTVMAGCGVRYGNVHDIIKETGVREVHASASFWA